LSTKSSLVGFRFGLISPSELKKLFSYILLDIQLQFLAVSKLEQNLEPDEERSQQKGLEQIVQKRWRAT